MILPDFFIIGAERSGTTWLAQTLKKHPHIYLPETRKEINFFDLYYQRGFDWYQKFFPTPEQASQYICVGEATPNYLYIPEVPERIYKHIPNCKLIAILRNPADRAYSKYGLKVRTHAYTGSFIEYLKERPGTVARGFYSQQIKRYLEYFPLEKLLILIFEETIKYPELAFKKIGNFLSVDNHKFEVSANKQKINSSYHVYFARPYALAHSMVKWLVKNDLDWIYNTAKNFGLRKELFGNKEPLPLLDPDIRKELLVKYQEDIHQLEKLIGIDLSIWTL